MGSGGHRGHAARAPAHRHRARVPRPPRDARLSGTPAPPARGAAYLDVDCTLLGPGGSALRGEDGVFSPASVEALGLLHAAGVPAVLVSGRSRPRLETCARLLGADGALPELGALECGYPTLPGQTVHAAIAATGIVDDLLAREPGLEPHAAAAWGREGSHVLRGRATSAAAAWVAARSAGALRLADNGRIGPGDVHVFHLLPAGASKAAAVAADVGRRGVDPATCLVVGDSAEDMAVGEVVGRAALVRNGAEADPPLAARVAWVTRGRYGEGVREAVAEWLAGA